MAWRTHPYLVLGPAGNIQCSLKYFDLKTAKVVTRRTFNILTMPDRVIKMVNTLGNGQNAIKYGNKVEFLNRLKTNSIGKMKTSTLMMWWMRRKSILIF